MNMSAAAVGQTDDEKAKQAQASAGSLGPLGSVDLLNGSVEIDGIKYLSEDELDRLDLDTKIIYIFLLVQQKDNQRIGKKLDEISGITDLIGGANEIFSEAAKARESAGKDGESELPNSVLAFSDQYNLGLESGKKYSREDWDINMELIQKQQNQWIYESEVVSYDLEKMMSEAATNLQLASKMLGSLQSIREKNISSLQFR